jgi:steroid delta-isomerase-like uncharacterized protein
MLRKLCLTDRLIEKYSQAETLEELNENLREVIEMLLEDGEPKLDYEFVGTEILRIGPKGIKRGKSMDNEKNKAIARRFIQVWGRGELDIIDELASPELSVLYPVFPRAIKGIVAFKQHLTKFRSAFGDRDVQIDEEIAEGGNVALLFSFSAAHQADYMGIPATGRRLEWTGITIYHIAGEKVVEKRGEEDYLGVFRQLGFVLNLRRNNR